MRFNKMGTILIAENEAELIWYAMGEWFRDEKWLKGGSRGIFRF